MPLQLNWFTKDEGAIKKAKAYLSKVPDVIAQLGQDLEAAGGGPFFGGEAPAYGEFVLFTCIDNMCTLFGKGKVFPFVPTARPLVFPCPLAKWYARMLKQPAIKRYMDGRPKPGSGKVGRQGSIIFLQEDPADYTDRSAPATVSNAVPTAPKNCCSPQRTAVCWFR